MKSRKNSINKLKNKEVTINRKLKQAFHKKMKFKPSLN